jgi:hypothetical protein
MSIITEKKGEVSEKAKELCLEKFIKAAEIMEIKLKQVVKEEFMFDYVDPSSGVLMKSSNPNAVYYESLGVDHYLK